MKLVLVDDHVLFREGLASLLRSQPDIKLVGMASTVQDAVQIVAQETPDIVLMDFQLSDGNGVEATQKILTRLPQTKVVFLTIHDDDERLFAALRAGAKGYLLKNVSVVKLLEYLHGIDRGEAAIMPSLTSRLLTQFTQLNHHNGSSPLPKDVACLTGREIEVLKEVRTGASNREIAERLVISERTVKNHISNILTKLNLKNRHAAARLAQTLNL